MDSNRKRRWTYVATAIAGAIIIILAVIFLQQPIQNKNTPPGSKLPPVVTTAGATGVGETDATLHGNLAVLGTASNVSVGFLYGTDASLAGALNVTAGAQAAVGGFTEDLTGLATGTVYYFETWGLGDGFAAGSVLSFTTLTPNPPSQSSAPSVTTSAASGIGNASATLNGQLASLGTASSVTVGFWYGTSPTLSGALNASAGGTTSTGSFALGVTGLASNRTYYVVAWGLGDGFANGSVVSFKTAAVSPTNGSGNGHRVPPGWAHAKCPRVPDQAPAHGVRARCLYNETYGELKKEGGSIGPGTLAPTARDTLAAAAVHGKHGTHRASHTGL